MRCWACGRKGHVKRNCQKEKGGGSAEEGREGREEREENVCFNGGEGGWVFFFK